MKTFSDGVKADAMVPYKNNNLYKAMAKEGTLDNYLRMMRLQGK